MYGGAICVLNNVLRTGPEIEPARPPGHGSIGRTGWTGGRTGWRNNYNYNYINKYLYTYSIKITLFWEVIRI